jgi:hypothetical protein
VSAAGSPLGSPGHTARHLTCCGTGFALPHVRVAVVGRGHEQLLDGAGGDPPDQVEDRAGLQQYTAWKYGPARPVGKKLTTALNAIQAGRDADALRRYPMPARADPHGYWDKSLARIKAAGDNAASGSGLGGLLMAEAPLKDVPGIEAKLEAELKARHLA